MKKIRCDLWVCVSAILTACVPVLVGAQTQKPQLLRDPSVSRTQIAFSYAGYIWVVARDGSNLRRLTSGGHEAKPILSPDGAQLAFTAEYDGTPEVYVVSSAGGEPRRLTYHPADIGAVGWTPDGKQVVFSSARFAFAEWTMQLFTVPATGGFATAVPFSRASQGSYSADASHIAYVPNVQWEGVSMQGGAQDAWKRVASIGAGTSGSAGQVAGSRSWWAGFGSALGARAGQGWAAATPPPSQVTATTIARRRSRALWGGHGLKVANIGRIRARRGANKVGAKPDLLRRPRRPHRQTVPIGQVGLLVPPLLRATAVTTPPTTTAPMIVQNHHLV